MTIIPKQTTRNFVYGIYIIIRKSLRECTPLPSNKSLRIKANGIWSFRESNWHEGIFNTHLTGQNESIMRPIHPLSLPLTGGFGYFHAHRWGNILWEENGLTSAALFSFSFFFRPFLLQSETWLHVRRGYQQGTVVSGVINPDWEQFNNEKKCKWPSLEKAWYS